MSGRRVLCVFCVSILFIFAGCLGGQEDTRSTTPAGIAPLTSEDEGPSLGDDAQDADEGDESEDPIEQENDPMVDDPDATQPPEDDGGRRACHEHNPPRPVPPLEQQVASVDEVRCPGHFAVLSAGNGESFAVPSWQSGDWWLYEDQFWDYPTTRMQETVNGTTTNWGVGVYETFVEEWDEDGQPAGSWEGQRTMDSLMQPQLGGAINHELLFPLAEGKSWVYMSGSRAMVSADVVHEPDFLFAGETRPVWYVELFIERESGQESIKKLWLCEQTKNVLQEEVWGAHNGTATYLTLSSKLVDHHVSG